MTTENYSHAINHAEAARATVDHLEHELEATKVDPNVVKVLNAKIGTGLKLAEVYASLAVADQIADLERALYHTHGIPQ